MNRAEVVVLESQLESLGGDLYAVRMSGECSLPHRNPFDASNWQGGQKYLSVQPDGSYETREVVGGWETGRRVEDKLLFGAGSIVRATLIIEGV